jgi:hypothetical protein
MTHDFDRLLKRSRHGRKQAHLGGKHGKTGINTQKRYNKAAALSVPKFTSFLNCSLIWTLPESSGQAPCSSNLSKFFYRTLPHFLKLYYYAGNQQQT